MMLTGLLLVVPLTMVEGLRHGRGNRLAEVKSELASQWGESQRLVGPLVWVPVQDHFSERVETTDDDGVVHVHMRPVLRERYFAVLPQDLVITSELSPKPLHRGLYDVLVYNANVRVQASFERPEIKAPALHTYDVQWDKAILVVQVSDLSAVSAVDALQWGEAELRPESGTLPAVGGTAVFGRIAAFDEGMTGVDVSLDVRGMSSLYVGPIGEDNKVVLDGEWDSPSFTGFTLPEERTVGPTEFSATWSVPGVARPVPQVLDLLVDTNAMSLLRNHTVGVLLVETASPYVSVQRAITYGILIIALCLMTFFVTEQSLGSKMHPVQWLVNGAALVLFYLVLLATSEHLDFVVAYGLASGLTVGLVGVYTLASTRAWKAGAAVSTSLSLLYACMYGMLRSEDHALLMGTGLLVIALAGAMWVTRHVSRPHDR